MSNYPVPVSSRYSFPVYLTRAAAVAAGIDPGTFDPSLPIKQWKDPSASGALVTYAVADPTAKASGYVSMIGLPAAQADALNLPGVETYSTYVPAPCMAQEAGEAGNIGGPTDISSIVCSQIAAQAFLSAIAGLYAGKTLALVQAFAQGVNAYYYVYPDSRRPWQFSVNGVVINTFIQQFIAMQNANGAGAPGSWVLGSTGAPVWTPAPQITEAPAGAITLPIPITLQAGETLAMDTAVLAGAARLMVYNNGAQIAALQTEIAQLQAQLAQLQAAA